MPIIELFKRKPAQTSVEEPPQDPEISGLPHYFDINPPENPETLQAEIEEMLAQGSLSPLDFVTFTDSMINLVGGFGHKVGNGTILHTFAEIGNKLSGNSVEIRRHQGWDGPDAEYSVSEVQDGLLGQQFPVILREEVTVFTDPSMSSAIDRKLETNIPSFIPTKKSITGEEVQLFNPIQLKGKPNLDSKELYSIAANVYDFYKTVAAKPPLP